jgi:DNA recombination protein RmuC
MAEALSAAVDGLSLVEALLLLSAGLLAAALAALLAVWRRLGRPAAALDARLDRIERAEDRTERAVREEVAKSREEATAGGRHLREELAAHLKGTGDSLIKAVGAHASIQSEQLDSFAKQLFQLTESVAGGLEKIREANEKRLEEMRATVDEKLQGTLEKRLSEAFQQVSERLEAVHKGLGEMQSLANGVGDLKKVLTNVKARGTWGEIQLGELLASVLTEDQFERNVATKPGSNERVEFAIKLPGRDAADRTPVWLPIDAKFPHEDYHRLVEAEERADREAADAARRALEGRVREEARKIRDKYVDPPHTTDFGLLYLPTEGLYAEVLRRPGLVEKLQREQRVVLAGPTTLAAILNSLQMGFRTLAIQRRSSEVWQLLRAVKTNFGKLGDLLDGVQRKLDQASNQLESATKKSRYIEGRLGKVESLPEAEAQALLPDEAGEGEEDPGGV